MATALGLVTLPVVRLIVAAVFLACRHGYADTVDARCDLFPRNSDKASLVTECTFSQRQGGIGVQLPKGIRFDFSPQSALGKYIDQDGNPVTKLRGLGKQGVIFRMKAHTLYVYWSTNGLKPSTPSAAQNETSAAAARALLDLPAATPPFSQDFAWGKIQFRVESANAPGPNTVRITPSGLSVDNRPFQTEVQGLLTHGEVADINKDGSPELYLYVRSTDTPPRGALLALSVNQGKSLSTIHVAQLERRPDQLLGYRGWDQFAVVESSLVQRFPVFKSQAADSAPTSVRQIRYRLRQGEASWQLVADKVDDF